MRRKFSINFWALCGAALAFTACSDDTTGSLDKGSIGDASGLQSASYFVGQALQTRASSVDTWDNGIHSTPCGWESVLEFTLPTGAIDVTQPNFNKSGKVYYVPESFNGDLNLGWLGLNEGASLYNYGTITSINEVNFNGKVTFYNAGTLTYSISAGSRHTVINTGTLIVNSYGNIGDLYNNGHLTLAKTYNPYWNDPNAKADIPNDMSIYSVDGVIELPDETDLKATCDIHNLITAKGNVKIQNSKTQYICGLEVSGDLDMTQGHLQTSYVKANEIKFDGAEIWLLSEAHIVANKISMPNSATAIYGYNGSYALIETTDIDFQNTNNFTDSFSDNIRFKISGEIDFANSTLFGGQGKHFNTAAEYIAQFAEHTDKFNGEDISGTPECGAPYGNPKNIDPDEPTSTKLIEIGNIEAPNHDHNSDKPEHRHLSATCIDYNDGIFYTSYHMRGGNYANDQYDKDITGDENDVEGCIETWSIKTNEEGQNELVLGKYMWTYEFDFNHLIIDGDDIITVGHKENKGAIIARMDKDYISFDPSYEEGEGNAWTSGELKFKYLTTDIALEEEGVRIDYRNAGDGNCVIRANEDEYFVATYEGYGKIDATDFSRIKDEDGAVAFVSTPGSAKHIIANGSDIQVLYLNSRPETTATAHSAATLATINAAAFPFNATTTALPAEVQPIDGKNVIASNGTNTFACLGKGGLAIDGEIINFGENGKEPVNGVYVDNEYIYIATGSQLRVLDVNTRIEIAKHCIPNMSANYIKVVEQDGQKYIAVAFGQEGIKVFRLEK